MVRSVLSPFGGSYGRDPFFSLQREMNRLFDDTFRGFGGGSAEQQRGHVVEARMNVSETDQEFRITAELPGVEEKDVDVTMDGDVLTIRGEKKFEQENGGPKESYHFVERSYGSFQRSLQLPYTVNPEGVRAEFHNGVLKLSLPKSEHQQRSRKIPIGRAAPAQQLAGDVGHAEGHQEAPSERRDPDTGEQQIAH
jgi:HSP20 family protein